MHEQMRTLVRPPARLRLLVRLSVHVRLLALGPPVLLSVRLPARLLVFQPTASTQTKLTASVSSGHVVRTEQIFASQGPASAQLRLVTRECCGTAPSMRNVRKYETDASKNSFEIESA